MIQLLLTSPKLPLILNTFPITISIREWFRTSNLAFRLPFEIFLNIGILGVFDIITYRLPNSINPCVGDRARRRLTTTLDNSFTKPSILFILHITSKSFSTHTYLQIFLLYRFDIFYFLSSKSSSIPSYSSSGSNPGAPL